MTTTREAKLLATVVELSARVRKLESQLDEVRKLLDELKRTQPKQASEMGELYKILDGKS